MTEEKSTEVVPKEDEDSVNNDAPPSIKRDTTMTKTAEEGRAYLEEETREKTRSLTSSTESTPSIAGIKRPLASDDTEEEIVKDPKSAFKFRPATLQSGPADSKYSNNAQVQFGSSVSSLGFKPGAPNSGNSSNFKLDSVELSSRPNLTLGSSSSTGLLSASDQSSNKPKDSNHDSESANGSSKKNIFLQFIPQSSSSTQSSTGGFLFGSNLESRIAGNTEEVNKESDKTEKEVPVDSPPASNSVVFGGSSAPTLPEIERITGEEKEENVLQISAKLYVFDSQTHSWKERGRGELHLNDSLSSEIPQSRIVMRCSGTYKVLLNTTIWPDMTCELADKKSLRISAQDTDLAVKVFLIMSNPKYTMSLHKAVMKRITKLASTLSLADKQETVKHEEKSSIASNTESPSTG